jgi:hypothetical protein
MNETPPKEPDSEDAAARRREEVLKRVLTTPAKPQHPTNVAHQRRSRPAAKGDTRKPNSRG